MDIRYDELADLYSGVARSLQVLSGEVTVAQRHWRPRSAIREYQRGVDTNVTQ